MLLHGEPRVQEIKFGFRGKPGKPAKPTKPEPGIPPVYLVQSPIRVTVPPNNTAVLIYRVSGEEGAVGGTGSADKKQL
jgi:hypothetical protein